MRIFLKERFDVFDFFSPEKKFGQQANDQSPKNE